jgi:primosomal protein N' (replication factor Y)
MDGAYLRVALDHPLATLFDYRCDVQPAPRPGTLVQVPFGKRQAVGLVCEVTTHTDVPPSRLRAIDAVCTELPPLGSDWLALVAFAADYYQRGRGEVALPALPQALRDAQRWGRLAPELRYRLTDAGRAAPRCAARTRRRAAAARPGTRGRRFADAARCARCTRRPPRRSTTGRRGAAVAVDEIGWGDAPVPKAG